MSRALYPPSKATSSSPRIKVPACEPCNRSWMDDEPHFRNMLLIAGETNPAVRELWEGKTRRSFSYEDGKRRARDRGASFVVLVECKRHTRPVAREDVMVLESKLRDVNAQKGILFSTSGFQSGALDFAAAKRIATVAIVDGKWLYQTRAAGGRPAKPPPWEHFDPYAGIRMTKTQTKLTYHTIELSRVDAIVDWLADRGSEDEHA